MQHILITIEGKTPLLLNRFHEEAQIEASSGHHSHKEAVTPEEEAATRLYRNREGMLYFPAENLRQSLIAAGARHKIGRRSASADLAAALYILPEEIPIVGEWQVDSRPIVIPSTQGRILRHRPRFEHWSLSFTLLVDIALIDLKIVRAVVNDAGNYVGIGDFRPAKKGPYGRSEVVHWQVIEE